MKWFVLYTKPNFEIKVAQSILKIGMESYCPVYNQIKEYSDRKKKVQKPLIPSYVFVKIKDKYVIVIVKLVTMFVVNIIKNKLY